MLFIDNNLSPTPSGLITSRPTKTRPIFRPPFNGNKSDQFPFPTPAPILATSPLFMAQYSSSSSKGQKLLNPNCALTDQAHAREVTVQQKELKDLRLALFLGYEI